MGDAERLHSLALADHRGHDAVDAVAVYHRTGVAESVGVLEQRQAGGDLNAAVF